MAEVTTQLAINSLYMMLCSFLLIFTNIGIPMFYSGLMQRRSSFTMFSAPVLISAILFIDWYIWGYSLCYATSSNKYIGNLSYAVLRHLKNHNEYIYSTSRGDILSIMHFMFCGIMKLTCATLTFPACGAERARLLPMLLFIMLWSVLIYNPVTYWFWNSNGWLSAELNKLPVLDFAGGNCIHIVSGFTALAYAFYLGPRNPKILHEYRSSNNVMAIFGLNLLMCGWCGFIAGCDYNFSITSLNLIVGTVLCAFTAGVVWTAFDFYFSATPLDTSAHDTHSEMLGVKGELVSPAVHQRKLSVISFSSGAMCGLVVFTPAGGYLCYNGNFWKSIVCGVVGAAVGNLSTRLKYYMRIDDSYDVFAVHGVCGIVGSLLVGIFAEELYGSKGGWVEGHWVQLGYQLLGCIVTSAHVFVMSMVFLYLVDLIPGMHLRIDKDYNRRLSEAKHGDLTQPSKFSSALESAEIAGCDEYEYGEYAMDFMEFIPVIDPRDYVQDNDYASGHGEMPATPEMRHRKGQY